MRTEKLIAIVVSAQLLMAAAQPVRLQPSSQWVLDYAENSCRLIRNFGEGDQQTKLALESEAPGTMDMLVVGRPLQSFQEEVPAKFEPVQGEMLHGRAARSTDNGDAAVFWSRIDVRSEEAADRAEKEAAERRAHPGQRPPPLNLAVEVQKKSERQAFVAAVKDLEIDARHSRPVILETGSLAMPIKAFDQCSRDSLRDWGVDPDVEDKIVRPVWAPDPKAWFTAEDYPRGMAVRGEESVVKVRLLVDATGRVTKCTSLSHFRMPEFNQVVCDKFMQRAHFEPAELADGTKVPSYYVNRIVFRMERNAGR